MAIQQMALMAYKAPPAGGADSAYLPNPLNADSIVGNIAITFNNSGLNSANVSTIGTITTDYTWKTGPNEANAYEAKFIRTVGVTPTGSSVNTWITLGATDTPSWSLTLGTGQTSTGYMVIRNISNPGTELANVICGLYADPNA